MRPVLAIVTVSLALAALPSCASPAPTRLSQCARATIGTGGGVVTSPSGAAVAIPAGTVPAPIDVSVCVVELGHVPGQHSPIVEFAPTDLITPGTVHITMPVDDTTPANAIAEVRAMPSGSLLGAATTIPAGPGLVGFAASRLGYIRIMEPDGLLDGGPSDGGGADDVNRPDAPRPIGPVVVGPDLTPAAYDCLGTVALPVAGAPVPVTVHAIDWADRTLRRDYELHAFPAPSWGSSTGCADPGCAVGTTDASGDVMMMLTSGPLWVSTSSVLPTDPAHSAAPAWIAGLVVPDGATRIDVPVLSVRTQQAIANALTFGSGFVLGQVRDCAGAVVQRARVRVFDSATNGELFMSFFGGRAIAYGNGVGFPGGIADRTTLDGLYLVLPVSSGDVRIEAWGHRALGGEDVLLACESASFLLGQPIVLDLSPLRAGAPSACGSVP